MKKFLKVLLIIVLVIVAAVAGLFGYLTATEFKPEPVEAVEINGSAESTVETGKELSVLSWNVGYAGLGAESDFFMDGGKEVRAADKATVNRYLNGIAATVEAQDCDIVMLQEVDTNSARTYSINEAEFLAVDGENWTYAYNYRCPFVPIPVPPMGRINSGLFTDTSFQITEAARIALPCPFSWPLSTANLKRCLLVSRAPTADGKELVIVNLHLEAYDSGEGKIAQTRQLREFIENEYKMGNYVIAGGDFNQVFPGSLEVYPNTHEDLWAVGVLTDDMLPEGEGWEFNCDLSHPTCRLLNQPYDPADTVNTQFYVIDGFITSPNVRVLEVNTVDANFENSDHNPVRLSFVLGE